MELLIGVGLLTMGSLFMAIYVYGLYKLGNLIADRLPLSINFNVAIIVICIAWIPLSSFVLLFPGPTIVVLASYIAVVLTNAYPVCIGFAAGRFFMEQASKKRFSKNVDDWLSEWESQRGDQENLPALELPPPSGRESEPNE
jgi:hypothetical protein